ncbi:Pyruvate oxidase [Leifsonia rubra CMS 76R]|nr:Pyruvate oxidase [Leifsonia rubra CMS 76R]
MRNSLAIASHIPSFEIGSEYFQETHPDRLFVGCSNYHELVSTAAQAPRVVDSALLHAISLGGVAVITLPGDIAELDAVGVTPELARPGQPALVPADTDVTALADAINESQRIAIFAGPGVAGAHDILLGTDFPYEQFLPDGTDERIALVDAEAENLGRRAEGLRVKDTVLCHFGGVEGVVPSPAARSRRIPGERALPAGRPHRCAVSGRVPRHSIHRVGVLTGAENFRPPWRYGRVDQAGGCCRHRASR